MKVRHTGQSRADQEEIGDWIATGNPVRAVSFIDELRAACATLSTHARRHPVVRPHPAGDIRKKNWRRYLIFYRIAGQEVQILRIVHGSRVWANLLSDRR